MSKNSSTSPVVVVAVVLLEANADLFSPHRDDQVLIARRGPQDAGAGHWEFPGGKVDPGENHEQALRREIDEELAVKIDVGGFVGVSVHAYPEKTIELFLYWGQIASGEITLNEHDAFEWLKVEDIDVNRLSQADRPFVTQLRSILKID